MIQKELWPSSQMMFTLHRRCSLLDSRSSFLRIVEILQVEVESRLGVEQLIVNRRLELPAHFDADILDCAIARLCRIADFHCLRHGLLDSSKAIAALPHLASTTRNETA